MIDVKELKKIAQGKWLGIFDTLGIITPRNVGEHGPCPACGGKDRFRLDKDTTNGTYYCNQCGSSDGISLVQKSLGMTFPDTIRSIADIVGYVDNDEYSANDGPSVEKKKQWLNELWSSSTELTGSCQVSRYLHGRGLSIQPRDVMFCEGCYNSDLKKSMPAMVAKVRNSSGVPVTIHRTYLDGNKKADIEKPKKLMPATSKLGGCAVRLFPTGGDVVGVAEGIETAIAASQLFFMPVWATISTTIMESFEPPDGVRRIVIFSDNDSNFAGQKSAYRLANKLYLKDYIVEVNVPVLNDYADEAMAEMRRSASHQNQGGVE